MGSNRSEVFFKEVFLKISQNSQENICVEVFFNKVADAQALHLEKLTIIFIRKRKKALPETHSPYDQFEKSEANHQRCSLKKVFLEISQNPQEKTCTRDCFLIKLQANFINKESLAQVFSCEFCEISKSTFFYITPPDDCF